jgi:hypothetical protein
MYTTHSHTLLLHSVFYAHNAQAQCSLPTREYLSNVLIQVINKTLLKFILYKRYLSVASGWYRSWPHPRVLYVNIQGIPEI